MKTKYLLIALALFFTCRVSGQFTFGVSPGFGLNSAYFGYKPNDKIVLFIGFQYLNINYSYEESGLRYNWQSNRLESYDDLNKVSESLYVPNVGIKYYIKQQNKLHAYLTLNISKPMLGGKSESNGVESESFKKSIKGISMWGGELGFGAEYFFDENFSLGGEFGLRYIYLKNEQNSTSQIYNPATGTSQTTEIKNDYKLNISPTYSKISLNFYF